MSQSKPTPNSDVLVHPFEAVAVKLRRVKFILIFVLLAFLLGGLLLLRGEITAENIRFLLRDLDFSSPTIGLDASAVSFDYDTSQTATLYGGDLAVLKRSSLEIHAFNGTRMLNEDVAFSSPALVAGEKYLLAYDIGGTKIGIYNSFSELYSETFDYNIFCADIADDGTFAVVTSEKGYHSALYIYNSEFKRTFRFATPDKVIYDMKLCRENPALVALACVRAEGGDFLTEILVFNTSEKSPVFTYSIDGEMPLEIAFQNEGGVSVLTNRSLRFLDSDGNILAQHSFSEEELALFHAEDGLEALVRNSGIIGTTLEIDVFYPDNKKEPYTFSIQNQVIDLRFADDNLYLLSYDSLTVFDLNNKDIKTHPLDHEYKQILPLSGGRIAFVGEGSVAIYMVG